jgi:glycerol-3-phosphate acyltransferase PlsX
MRIALDAMGGDSAPAVPVRGGLEALDRTEELELLLVGDPEAIERELSRQRVRRDRLEIVPASEVIGMGEPPVEAVRAKPGSSIVRGLELQKGGEADAFVSAGSTGAILAASIMILGSLPGIDRPALGALLPTAAPHPTLLLDVGANVDCRPQQLERFAHLGHIYVRDLVGREAPRIGLLNIGTEAGKGDDRTLEAYRLLGSSGLNFVGNIEGRDILSGKCDVLVCDGFVGNVVLKFYESVAAGIADLVSRTLANAGSSIDLRRVCRVLDYAEYGGAPLLGVDGVVVICHGGSPARAVRHAVHVAARAVESGMVAHLERELEGLMRVGARA